ncbi:MAG: MBL fold metallo-hydrolase [Clostridiaceae bacterium]|nr:MBL fold metallo-hydrolase [Clostridiaceae bacterium]
MKSKVLIEREPIEPLSKAWMKELRLYNKTKREYEIDPYAEVYQFRDNVYGILTDSADGMGAPWMYLIIGPEKAMLIDTSFGIGNLKGLVDEITGGMPVVVVNTHSSYDHSYGNCQFDQVYCHKFTAPYLQKEQTPHLWDYLTDEEGKGIWLDFDKNDIIPFKKYGIISCENNHVFDLGGGYEVELILLPGHHAGHTGFLDKRNRILFCGDAFISMRVGLNGPKPDMPYGEFATVRAFKKELEKLVKRTAEFDTLFPGHFIVDIDNSVVQNMLDVCAEILENSGNCDYEEMDAKGRLNRFKFVKGLGVISYNENSVG